MNKLHITHTKHQICNQTMCVKLHTVGRSGLEVSDLEDTGPCLKFPAIQCKQYKNDRVRY